MEEADLFIRTLSKELGKFRLKLNTKKTKIIALPAPIDGDWVQKLRAYTSHSLRKKKFQNKDIVTLSDFIDLSVNLLKENSSDCSIRYAVKVLSSKEFADDKVFAFILMYLSRVCFIYPYFIDVFDEILERNKKHITTDILEIIKREINCIAKEHIKYSRSDVALWSIYLSIKYGFTLDKFESYSDKLISDRDCLPTLLCYEYAKAKGLLTKKYLDLILKLIDEKTEDEWWVYIYHLFSENPTKPQVKKIAYKAVYDSMRKGKVAFLKL